MIWLLDASILIGLTYEDHTAHDRCSRWFSGPDIERFATCPITQSALIRVTLHRRPDLGVGSALAVLDEVVAHRRHEFWPDDLSLGSVSWNGVVGHRQVTDAYLAGLARSRGGRLITLDAGLATLHPDVAHLPE
jgi:uncharacterized protein